MKAYVIRLKDIESSELLAQECIDSASKFNLTVKPFNGIYGEEQINKQHELFKIRPWKAKMKKHRLGVRGCFLSHFTLWKCCVQEQVPYIIFEHDAVMLRPLPQRVEDKFFEFLMLDPYNKMKKEYEQQHQDITQTGIKEYFNNDVHPKYGVTDQYAMGLQAYIIKPKAAKRLISYVEKNGYLPADIQCNKGLLSIETIYPSIASINPKFYDKKLMKEESTTHKLW